MAVHKLALTVYALTALSCLCQNPAPSRCGPTNCKLPDCFCFGNTAPNGLRAIDTPQMVVFTLNGPVNDDMYEGVMDMFGLSSKRLNPNGCPIGITLFVSHMNTDYCKVAEFYREGHEVASNSITHKLPLTYWSRASYIEYDLEIDGEATMIESLAGINKSEVKGFQAPFFETGGDNQFSVLHDRKYTYDSSVQVTLYGNAPRVWPYTLDIPYQSSCSSQKCPTKPYPGLWELPVQRIQDHETKPCDFVDECINATSVDDVYNYLMGSFNTSYNVNKAPLALNIHSTWFGQNPYSLEGSIRFINGLVAMDDVYIITSSQLVSWMRTPKTLDQALTFEPWKCANRTTSRCTKKIMKAGSNRKKKADFESYRYPTKPLMSKVGGPEDGGVRMVLGTLVLFGVGFIYFIYYQ